MTYILIGVSVSIFTILFLEIFRAFDKRLFAALILVGIAFIYVGFAWNDLFSLGLVSAEVLVWMLLAYYGYTKDFRLIIWGLVLHGTWDMVYPHFGTAAPKGYDKLCLTIDLILAVYFYLRTKRPKDKRREVAKHP